MVSPRFFEALSEHSPDALLGVDPSGTIVFANPRTRALLGYEPDELVGTNVDALVPARFRGHDERRLGYAAAPSVRAMGSRALRVLHKSGHEVACDISLSPLEDGLVLASLRDATDRVAGEQGLRLQAAALDVAASGIVITDRAGVIQWVNPAVCVMTGYAREELVGQHTRLLRSGRHEPAVYEELWSTISAGRTWSGQLINRRKDGTLYWADQLISPLVEEGEVVRFVAATIDVTARREAELALAAANEALRKKLEEVEVLHQQLRDQAIRDPLTGLHNRRFLEETFERELARAARSGTPLSVVVIDLDRLKVLNDTLGHAAGDEVLRRLGEVLRARVRRSDIAYRVGGDEFLVVMPGATALQAARRAEDWRSALGESLIHVAKDIRQVGCSLSMGVADALRSETGDQLLARADQALYRAKEGGRDRVVVAA